MNIFRSNAYNPTISVSSDGSRRGRFRPDRTDYWTIQRMGPRCRLVRWVEITGQTYRKDEEKLSHLFNSPVQKAVYLMNAIGAMRETLASYEGYFKLVQRSLHEGGFLMDPEFPPQLRHFILSDQRIIDMDYGSTELPDAAVTSNTITTMMGLIPLFT